MTLLADRKYVHAFRRCVVGRQCHFFVDHDDAVQFYAATLDLTARFAGR